MKFFAVPLRVKTSFLWGEFERPVARDKPIRGCSFSAALWVSAGSALFPFHAKIAKVQGAAEIENKELPRMQRSVGSVQVSALLRIIRRKS